MATSADNGDVRDDRKRLIWLLDKMIGLLDTVEPAFTLAEIREYEKETAELIETTGLADELNVPTKVRPAFRRSLKDDGLLVHWACRPRGTVLHGNFDQSICSAVKMHTGVRFIYAYNPEAKHGYPKADYVALLRETFSAWKEEALAPRRSSPPVSKQIAKPIDNQYQNVLMDIFEPGNEWLSFDLYIDLYQAHVRAARARRDLIVSNPFDEQRQRFESEVSAAIHPFMLCIDEHLKRVVREHPQHLSNVTEIRSAIFRSGSLKADEEAAKALAKAIELIKAVNNGHPPCGRALPKRDARGAIISLSWQWAEEPARQEVGSQASMSKQMVEPRCVPMAKTDMARLVFGSEVRARKLKTKLEKWELAHFEGNLWTVRLDLMPLDIRKKFEAFRK